MLYSKRYPDYTTVTCLEWKQILSDDNHKDIIIESMRFLVNQGRATIYGFVILDNHFHLVWQMLGDYELANVQCS